MLSRVRSIYHDLPKPSWILIPAFYIDGIGRSSVPVFSRSTSPHSSMWE